MQQADRIEALYRRAGFKRSNGADAWMARGLGLNRSALAKWRKGERPWPTWFGTVLDLLEAAPVESWPPRFERHDGK